MNITIEDNSARADSRMASTLRDSADYVNLVFTVIPVKTGIQRSGATFYV